MDKEGTQTYWTKNKKLMTIHKAFHLKDDIDRLYESRKGERRRGKIIAELQ